MLLVVITNLMLNQDHTVAQVVELVPMVNNVKVEVIVSVLNNF